MPISNSSNLINLPMSWHFCRCVFSREVSGRSLRVWKMLPLNVLMALFCFLLVMQNLFLLHRQLVIVLVARIRLLWILEVLIQLRRRCHRRRFHPYWMFPRPAECWFEIHLHQRHFPDTLFRRHMRMGRESFDDLLRLLRHYVQRENTRFRDCCDGNCKKYSCCVAIWES